MTISGHGSSPTCLYPRDILLLSLDISRIRTSISWSFSTTSFGCFTTFVQDRSETCTKPSIPSSNAAKAPNWVKFWTIALCTVPTIYFSSISSQGSGVSCFTPKLIFLSSISIDNTLASTSSPILYTSEGFLICLVQDISETWTKPSTPGSSSIKQP